MTTVTRRAAAVLVGVALAVPAAVAVAAPASAHASCSSHTHSVGSTGYPEKWVLVSRTSSSCTSDVWFKNSASAWKYGGRVAIRF